MNWQNWVFFGSNILLITPLALIWVFRVNPVVLAARNKIGAETARWDKVLLALYWFSNFFVIYLLAGWDATQIGGAPNFSFWLGMALVVAATILATKALAVNPYLESTARIQTDRSQVVVSAGVYSAVRHPTYAAGLLGCLAVALIFSSPLVWGASAVIAGLVIVRTYLEDKMLLRELPGYRRYGQQTKYRLIPLLW